MLRSLVMAVLLALAICILSQPAALAADPTPGASPAPSAVLIDPLDPRAGEGASSVGAPLLALLVVVGLGTVAAAGTLAYARFTRSR
jgi:hypothetical protein